MPTTELHLHLEGALTARRALQLAQPLLNEIPPIPAGLDQTTKPPHWHFTTLMGFLELFGWSTRLLRDKQSYGSLFKDLLAFLDQQEIQHAEVFVAVGQMLRLNISPNEIVPQLAEIAYAHAEEGGCEVHFIADCTRQWGVQAAERVLDAALELRECRIIGFGMGGDETAIRAREFKRTYRRAADNGLGLHCHAGEGTNPDAVREVVEELDVRRVGHGIAAAQDNQLMRDLADEQVILEVCPTSNERTRAWDGQSTHPVITLIEHEVPVVLGSDDPSFFNCSLKGEFERLKQWGVSEAKLEEIDSRATQARFPKN